ncbi:ABC transporter substrate-binding protein [Actinotalea sp. M2MS4P-6]|uniref:ABC transporter substrate-binding protein n=1 Tax=Actinotalea sp. M2MS4P-6 TaxID=2983762 RepID=UPI0021E4F143|nr:ABC transporter substrate-binding protein [Actinotalea sp. M2MS4P-6]MCV2394199.1 ABC transporter substrate-binding protein [Actinotalea sp. M2MS4P-6]
MRSSRLTFVGAAVAALALASVSACSSSGGGSGSDGSSSSDGGSSAEQVEITLLTDDAESTLPQVDAVIAAFEAKYPNITVKATTRPGGSDGDNLVKTKLATGEMEDVFWYNSGSLLAALDPANTLVPLDGTDAIANTNESFFPSVTVDGKIYGAPWGDAMGGGILYNKEVYADLGLEIPKTWDEFAANNEVIKAAGITPVLGSFADTWTTQLFVLGDFCNVAAAEPDWATKYTANQVNYADDPVALRGFEKTAAPYENGWLNSDAGSMTFDQAMAALAAGDAAQYPQLTFPVGSLSAEDGAKIGFFGIPGDDAAKACGTIWMPSGQYIPAASEHIAEAEQFVAFVASPEGVAAMYEAVPPTGPSLVNGVTTPDSAYPVVDDIKAYIDGNNSAALEFLSPIKGPSLEQITTAVEGGQTSAADGAAQYDADVVKQAKQLGLEGW